VYDDTDNTKTVLRIESLGNISVTIENFEVRGNECPGGGTGCPRYGCGIHLLTQVRSP